jgi:glycosyltransferase involved in cell wall biosynthesis
MDDIEIIITDDSPNDELKKIKELDSRIKYIKNEPALGSPRNWNKAISLASGEYVKIMHHDDYFIDNSALTKMVTAMDATPNAAFGFCAFKEIGEGHLIERPLQYNKLDTLSTDDCLLINDNFIGPPSAVIVRNNKKHLFDEHMIWFVDVDYYISLLRESYDLVAMDEYLVAFGVSESQTTAHCMRNSSIIANEYLYMMGKYDLEEEPFYQNSFLKLLAKHGLTTNEILDKTGVNVILSGEELMKVSIFKYEYLVIRSLKSIKKALVGLIKTR